MIDYVEIREPVNRQLIGICDVVESIIWQPVYFGVGEFEVYAEANVKNLAILKSGNYVTRIDDINCGIITDIEIVFDEQKGRMIAASGKFAKVILAQRIIYKFAGVYSVAPAVLKGNVAEAVWKLIENNCGANAPAYRQFSKFGRGNINDLPAVIVDENGNTAEKQVTYDNLQEYTDALLQEYSYGAYVWLDTFTGELLYVMYKGADRSRGNTEGNTPVIFSRDYDTLSASTYTENTKAYKTTPIIGGEDEGLERFVTVTNNNYTGYNRREMFVDAASIKKTLKASETQEMFPTGTFTGTKFVVGGVTYANIVMSDTDKERVYTLKTLQENFPTGTTSGTKFVVGGNTYADKVYGDDGNYKLTLLGYKAMLDVEETEGNYLLTDAIYKGLLVTHGIGELREHQISRKFTGTIDTANSRFVYGRDYFVGDIVTVEDAEIGIETKCRILKVTETLSTSGYSITAEYETV